ncbi:MAG: LPS export ABC transporter periplasmic protein LptC [bacterium]
MDQLQPVSIPPLIPPDETDSLGLFERNPWMRPLWGGFLWAIALCSVGLLIYISTVKSQEVIRDVFTETRSDVSTVEDLRALGYDEKGKTWEVYSEKASEERNSQQSEIKDISILNIYKDGKVNVTGRGDIGRYNKADKQLNLRDNVYLEDTDGTTTLVTQRLTWFEGSKILRCPKPVFVTIENNRIHANALYADNDMTHLEFVGDVRMFLTGLEKESLVTREGIVDQVDVAPEKDDEDAKKGMWVHAQYVYYDKTTKQATCYPFIPADAQRNFKRLERAAIVSNEPVEEWPPQPEEGDPAKGAVSRADLLTGPDIPAGLQDRRDRQVLAWRENKRIFSDRMAIDLKVKRADPESDVLFFASTLSDRVKPGAKKIAKALAKDPTSMHGDHMSYYWKKGQLEAWDGVEVFQRDKRMTSNHLAYDDAIAILAADGNVVIHQASGDWLEREGILDDVTEDKAREDARKPATIYADAALAYEQPGYLYLAGNVKVVQTEQRAWGDIGEYHDGEEWILITGNVDYANTKGEVVKAEQVKLHLHDSIYEIFKGKQVRVEMPEKYSRQIEDAKAENS